MGISATNDHGRLEYFVKLDRLGHVGPFEGGTIGRGGSDDHLRCAQLIISGAPRHVPLRFVRGEEGARLTKET